MNLKKEFTCLKKEISSIHIYIYIYLREREGESSSLDAFDQHYKFP